MSAQARTVSDRHRPDHLAGRGVSAIMMVIWETMKTTLELPDELMRSVKVLAARQNRRLKDVVAELLRRGLAADPVVDRQPSRVQLPLVQTSYAPSLAAEMTPDRVAAALTDEEAANHT